VFRHERPQKGRYRPFNQIGVEDIQSSGPDMMRTDHPELRSGRQLGLQDGQAATDKPGPAAVIAALPADLVSYLRER